MRTLNVLGNFNHCDLRKCIPKFHQFVNFPTRGVNILDKCYCHIKGAYTAVSKLHFGKCDHLAILLQPTYMRKLKAGPVRVKTEDVDRGCTGRTAGVLGGHRYGHL